jgi:glutathione S-transferase
MSVANRGPAMLVLQYMKLYYSPTSPFARKVILSASVLGLGHELELESADVYQRNISYVTRINPLNKIPALQTREGNLLVNSPFICDYLNSLPTVKKVIPTQGPERWKVLNNQAIADGIMEAAVLRRYEVLRKSHLRDPNFDKRQWDKINDSLQYFESHLAEFLGELQLDGITLLCAIGYLDFRFAHETWLERFPRLREWYNLHKEWKPFIETVPK